MKKILFVTSIILAISGCSSIKKDVKEVEESTSVHASSDNISASNNNINNYFLQKGTTASYKETTLTLNRVFHTNSMNGQEVIAKISNSEFLKEWPAGEIRIAKISYKNKIRVPGFAILELSNPKVEKRNALSYKVKVKEGKLVKIMGEVNLEITLKQQ